MPLPPVRPICKRKYRLAAHKGFVNFATFPFNSLSPLWCFDLQTKTRHKQQNNWKNDRKQGKSQKKAFLPPEGNDAKIRAILGGAQSYIRRFISRDKGNKLPKDPRRAFLWSKL